MSVNETIKRLRTERKLTQNDLAEMMNCNRQKIADLERGKSTPSANDLILLSKIFNVSADYLLGLSDTATNDKDIQFICEYTGLDEISVRELHKLQKLSTNKVETAVAKISYVISGKRPQDAELDLNFINSFLSSPFNAVFNHRDSYLYEYYKNLEKCIELYNQVIDFEIKENYDSAYLFQQWNTFDDKINEVRKKVRIDRYLITDDFVEALEFFVNDKLSEIKEKEELSREKLNSMLEIISKSAGDE